MKDDEDSNEDEDADDEAERSKYLSQSNTHIPRLNSLFTVHIILDYNTFSRISHSVRFIIIISVLTSVTIPGLGVSTQTQTVSTFVSGHDALDILGAVGSISERSHTLTIEHLGAWYQEKLFMHIDCFTG